MIFDSKYDSYRGAVPYVRIMDGEVKKGDKIKFFSTEIQYEIDEVGYLIMDRIPADKLSAGEVGYVICNIRNVSEAKVGDTITYAVGGCDRALSGIQRNQVDGLFRHLSGGDRKIRATPRSAGKTQTQRRFTNL